MGQKVSPVGLRLGINKNWESKWYAGNNDFAKYLNNDVKIRKCLSKKLKDAAVSSILIERNSNKTEVIINTAKPGVVIGHGGDEIEKLKNELSKLVNENVQISIMEVKNPDVDYAAKEADTTYGKIGVKVWIYKGEILASKEKGGNVNGTNTKKN